LTLIALLFTIVVMFSLKGDLIVELPLDVVRIAIPLLIYFVVMFLVSFGWGRPSARIIPRQPRSRLLPPATTLNWRLRWRWRSSASAAGAAFAAVIGPLVEVPVMIGLVNVAFWLQKRWYPQAASAPAMVAAAAGSLSA
jgi:arsenite transporter